MVTLTPTQAAFLVATAPHAWDIPRVIADPDHHRDYTDTAMPWQALNVDRHLWQVTITERALVYTDHRDASSHRGPVTIRWSALREYAHTITTTQRQTLIDAVHESRAANVEFHTRTRRHGPRDAAASTAKDPSPPPSRPTPTTPPRATTSAVGPGTTASPSPTTRSPPPAPLTRAPLSPAETSPATSSTFSRLGIARNTRIKVR